MCGMECPCLSPLCSACYGLCKQGILCCHHCIPVFAAWPFLLLVLLVHFCLTVGALTSIAGAVCQCWIKKWRSVDKPRDGFIHGVDIKEEPAMTFEAKASFAAMLLSLGCHATLLREFPMPRRPLQMRRIKLCGVLGLVCFGPGRMHW